MAQLPAHLAGLLRAEAYPHAVSGVELVETHISWVLLTGEFAYKIKRPVCYPFVDLRSAERRAFFCAEEMRLNRRFAPELYLDVCDIRASNDTIHVGGEGRLIERCVRMRQFPRHQELDRLLEEHRIEPAALERFGRDLADIHARLPVAGAQQPWGWPTLIRKLILQNLDEYVRAAAALGIDGGASTLCPALEAKLRATSTCMSERRNGGRVRECHGDLHTRNVVQCGSRLIAFDCMEFEPAFRWIDVAEEIALLLTDLEARGCPGHAHAFLSGYLAASGDYEACRVVDLYKAHRALVRAKVAALEVASAADERAAAAGRAQHDVQLRGARNALAHGHPRLILMSGLSGSGKTWLAQRLAVQLGAIHMRSDVERKRAAGVSEHAASGSGLGSGLYAAENTSRVYEHLARCAEEVLAGGYSVIVDATFSKRSLRAPFQRLAQRIDVPVQVIQCEAPPAVLRERILQRQRAAADASEANLAVLDLQLREYEPITAAESLAVAKIDTSRPDPLADAVRSLHSRTAQ